MATKSNSNSGMSPRRMITKALKATIKGLIIYIAYFIIWQFANPMSQYVPGFQQMIEAFVTTYIALIILSELSSGTIYQHFLNAGKSLFIIAFLMLSLGTGAFGLTVENVSIMIDVRIFLFIAMLLGLLSLAKTVLQAINYMSDKVELTQV